MLFETKVKYVKTCEDGSLKAVRETYVVNADDVKDAQKRVTDEVLCFAAAPATFEVVKAARSNIVEVLPSEDGEGDTYFKLKAIFTSLDERTGKEETKSYYYLVRAHTFARALGFFDIFMHGTIQDYRVVSLSETAIVEVYS